MDVAFHVLTGLAISKGITGEYLAETAYFSVLPDLIGTIPYELLKIKKASMGSKSFKDFKNKFMQITHRHKFFGKLDELLYRSTHSWLTLVPVSFLAKAFSKEYWWLLSLCYFAHLLVDVLTHEKEFAQRIFYPLSDWHVEGKSFVGNACVYVPLWIVLAILLLLLN